MLRQIRVSWRRRLVAGHAVALAALFFTCGCETRGFIDPSELGRYQHDPLVLPVVSQVDPALEDDYQWARAMPPTADDQKLTSGDYRISRDDFLAITLTDINGINTETVKQTRVSESGNISLPFLDKPVRAEGRTEQELQEDIKKAYRDAGQVQNAQVSINVLEARGKSFDILGGVGGTGTYVIAESNFRLLNALTVARNVSSPFTDYIYIIRRVQPEPAPSTEPTTAPEIAPATAPATGPTPGELRAPGPQSRAPLDPGASSEGASLASADSIDHRVMLAQAIEPSAQPFTGFNAPGPDQDVRVIRIPYEALKRGELQYNIPIRAHDVIYVQDPQIGFYYMGGHVGRPGAYQLSGQKVKLKDAIISASMLDGLAIPQRAQIVRHIQPSAEIMVRVDLAKIFNGEQPDIYLKPGDEITVGSNAIAPFLAAARGGFRLSYGLGFLYDRNWAYSTNLQGTTGG